MSSEDNIADFQQLDLHPKVLEAIQRLGYENPTAVQARCIPHLLEGRDLLGQAQTGTGKTAAFALPLLSSLDLKSSDTQLLILAPTRELALQVAEACQSYARFLPGFHVLPVYGGQNMGLQLKQLKRGAQVVVGTPGRVMDHLRRKTLSLDSLQSLVLDEADEMLNMGFIEDIEWILEHTPAERQVALFSATMPDAIRKVARTHLKDPVEIRIESKTQTVTTIEQSHLVVTRHHKMDALTRILDTEDFDGMIIFVRTKMATTEVSDKLQAHGFAADALNGDMTQQAREKAVDKLKKGKLDIVVATDVAARGLDVERITHVLNYDIPYDPEAYVHRIGRTGRAGRKGKAILFVEPRERKLLKLIERVTRQQVSVMSLPTAEDISEQRIEKFSQQLRDITQEQDLDYVYNLVNRISREQEMSMADIAAALTFLYQKEKPFKVEALDIPKPREERERRSRDGGDKPRRMQRQDDGIKRDVYRIEVGHKHGATPREIVGAIANEAGLEGSYIGHIDIRENFSLVELPEGMPKDIYQHLRKVRVCGFALQLTLDKGPKGSGKPFEKKKFDKKKFDGKKPGKKPGKGKKKPAR